MAKIADPTKPRKIKIKEQRIPMVRLLNGKEIRDAASSLEQYRLKMVEQEFLFGATLRIKYDTDNRDFTLIAERLETESEVARRLEKAAAAAEAKRIREEKRRADEIAREEKRKKEMTARKISEVKATLDKLLSEGISLDDLVDGLKK
jgi:hypothetical protein